MLEEAALARFHISGGATALQPSASRMLLQPLQVWKALNISIGPQQHVCIQICLKRFSNSIALLENRLQHSSLGRRMCVRVRNMLLRQSNYSNIEPELRAVCNLRRQRTLWPALLVLELQPFYKHARSQRDATQLA